jgi:hypothetical protein
MTTDPTTPADEVKTLTRIVAILDKLDPAAQERVVGWMADRYPVEEAVGEETA